MTAFAITGANGFLGWHTRAAARAEDIATTPVRLGGASDPDAVVRAVDGAERVIHLAGVNRGSDGDVSEGNVLFAQQLADAVRRAERAPRALVFANSTQAGNGTVYGDAKSASAEILARAAADVGAEFVDVVLPNVFGEHGRPFYNAVTATFCHVLAEGGTPTVERDRELTLLHAQDAADLLLGAVPLDRQRALEHSESVSGLLARLTAQSRVYRGGDIPDLSTRFERDLFNTYRSYAFATHMPFAHARREDARGAFVELVRAHGGTAQTSFSTTAPGIVRGEHFHRRKVERFTVVAGRATIALRRLLRDDVVTFAVDGESPASVDMPTLWAHNLTNTGDGELLTTFWSNEIFDPSHPDTIAEEVS